MEEKVAAGLRQKLKACEAEIETQQASLEKKRLLLARVCHNWNCLPSPPTPSSSAPSNFISEPVLVPINAPSVTFAHHHLLSTGSPGAECSHFVKVKIHQRSFREQWVLIVEAEKSPDFEIEGVVPISLGTDGETISWSTNVVFKRPSLVVLVVARPLPEFCRPVTTVKVELYLLCGHDCRLRAGTAELFWQDLLDGRLQAVSTSPEEADTISEQDQRLNSFVLSALQTRLSFHLSCALLAGLSGGLETALGLRPDEEEPRWVRVRPGLNGCRVRILGPQDGDLRLELFSNEERQAALFSRFLLGALPCGASSTGPEERWLAAVRRRFREHLAVLLEAFGAEVSAAMSEAGVPNLEELTGASPRKMAAALSAAREVRGCGRTKLPRAVRERLRDKASALREAPMEEPGVLL